MNNFREEWFAHEEWWFDSKNKELDRYLSETYKELLFVPPATEDDHLSWVLVYDQLARHVYREDPEKIKHYLVKALEHADQVNRRDLAGVQLCFALLPYRHTNDIDYVNKAIRIVFDRLERCEDVAECLMLKRFLKAAYMRHPLNEFPKTIFCRQPLRSFGKFQLHTGLNNIGNYMDILEYYRCNIDMSLIFRNHPCYMAFDMVFKMLNIEHIIISLSGGKDSMVSSFIMADLAKKYQIKLCAVHINYCNRREVNDKELVFLQDWCDCLNIPFYWRNIIEINRERCMKLGLREIYESFTRNVRFDTYKRVWNEVTGTYIRDAMPIVVLGHNKDDCFENIMTNIVQEKKYDNLRGMETNMIMDGVRFLRPLLEVSKAEIINFAEKHKVPYLFTSTPSWSHRGKIRSKVLPCMLQWDDRAEASMFSLADKVAALYKIMEHLVDYAVSNTKNMDSNGQLKTYVFNKKDIIRENIFWFEYFKRVCGERAMPSKRSIDAFLGRLCNFVTSNEVYYNTKVILSKKSSVDLAWDDNDKVVMMIKIDLKK